MNANELRLGNYVHGPLCELCIVKQLGIDNNPNFIEVEIIDGGVGCNGTRPIPLTEEWLLRFGFVNRARDKKEWVAPNFRVCKTTDNYFVWPDFDLYYIELPYVHQLQNLYFALTRQELTIKEASR